MKLTYFKDISFLQAIKALFNELNVPVNYVADEPTSAQEILKYTYKEKSTFQLVNEVYFVGMVDDAAFEGNKSLAVEKIKSDYDGILIFGVSLNQRENNLLPTRSQLAEISRAFNREFYYTPVVLVFKYADDKGQYIAFANTERLQYKQAWREGEKAGKVSLLRDIDIQRPHRGHEDIINQLRIQTSGTKAVDTFAKLYAYWQEVFSVSVLNKRFYQELSNWYFWAVKQVTFPDKPTEADAIKKNAKLDDLTQEHNATNVIRLLTRLLFTWFIKEKKLIPEELFNLEALQKDILNDIAPYHESGLFNQANKDSVYYRAILQNLFFASLNCPIKPDSTDSRERGFRGVGYGTHRGIDYLMRYKRYFKNPDTFLELMNKTVPFLNGGLFECLDDKYSNTYIDGFSDQMTKGEQLIVPDYLFFGTPEEVDLSTEYGVNNNTTKKAAVKGLINILKSYKFTITENTPIEEDVALDPELLGKVFENLLASYNPETKTTARKQTGSFYTPREIVNYMVDESLIAYLKNTLSFQLKDKLPESSSFDISQRRDASGTFFNPNDEIDIHEGKLPHWNQKEVFYHVTFRLADSLPKDKVEELKADRDNWQKKHKDKKEFTKEEWREYNRLFNERVEDWMNNGYGSCLLKKKENAQIVANALKHFGGQRYVLDEWVIMPNHVHVLVKAIGNNKLSDILHSWKSFTANEINKKEGRSGQLWMHESYDHIVRNEDALKSIRHYIRMNPVKAGIVAEASSVLEDSSYETSQSKDALDTMLHQLASFDSYNPFANDPETTRQIVSALDRCKILDPACGSGAFPMGVLQKMVHMLQKLDPNNQIWKEVQIQKVQEETNEVFKSIDDKAEREEKLKEINNAFDQRVNDPDYARKLYLIENCIYGVDIQPIATQISKLRFFISLVVDQRSNSKADENFGIRPLPNLETKFVTANTLIGINKEANLFTTDTVKDLEKQLKHIRHKLFSACTKDTKLKYRQKDEELRKTIAEELKKQGLPIDSAEKLAKWDPYDQNASSPFFDSEWMFDIQDGFNIVIGNPPYVFTRDVEFDGNFKKYIEDEYFSKMIRGKKSKSNQSGKINLFAIFIVKGLFVSCENGYLTYIIPNNILRTTTYDVVRRYLLENSHIEQIVDLGSGVFDNVTASTVVLGLSKKQTTLETKVITEINSIEKYDFRTKVFDQTQFLKNVSYSFNIYMDELSMQISNVIASNKKTLESYCVDNIEGIVAHKHLVFDSEGANRVPLIEGKDIKRYSIRKPSNFLLWDTKEIHRTRPDYLWKSEKKIIIQRISGGTKPLVCAVDLNKHKSFASTNNLILKEKLKNHYYFFSAIINSDVINWYYANNFSNNSTLTVNISKTYMDELPIAEFSTSVSLVSEILHHISDDSYFAQFSKLINALIFNLYFPDHMKEREIDVIEIVESDIEKAMNGREFEKLSAEEKEQVIEQLHQNWSHPDSEVRNRIKLFAVRSPEILKPILES